MTTLGPDERVAIERRRFAARLAGGATAGLAGGLLSALGLAAASAARGLGAGTPLAAIASTWLDERALVGGAPAVALGLATHLAVAAACGALFGLLVPRRTRAVAALLLGASYGLALFLLLILAVAPLVAPVLAARVELERGTWALAFALFGAALALAPLLARRRGPAPARETPAPATS